VSEYRGAGNDEGDGEEQAALVHGQAPEVGLRADALRAAWCAVIQT
jgi:hypothetical protein